MIEGPAADLEGVRHVGEVELCVLRQMGAQVRRRTVQGKWTPGRQDEQRMRSRRTGFSQRRRLFEYDVRVGPADAERTDAGPTGAASGPPRSKLPVYVEGARLERDLRIGSVEVQARRQLPMPEVVKST